METTRPPTLRVDGVLCLLALRKELLEPEGRLGKGKYSYLISGPLLPAGRSLHGVLLVAWTQHEQVAGTPLDVELGDNVEVEVRESHRLTLLDL